MRRWSEETAHKINLRRPGQAKREPGPIRRALSWRQRGGRLAQQSTLVAMGPGVRRDEPQLFVSANRRAAVDHHGLAGHEIPGLRAEEYRGARDLVGNADTEQRRPRRRCFQILRI